MATDRILVHEKIAPQFEAVFTAVLGKMFNASNAPDALISPAARERVEALVAEATAAGASILNGAWQSSPTPSSSSAAAAEKATPFVRPLVLRNTTPSMRIWTHEIFGSVACITPFATEEQAIALANDSEYGLSHAVFTENLGRGPRVARALESGQVRINAITVHESPELPFGGVKASGWGRVNAMAGIEEFLVSKAVTWVD